MSHSVMVFASSAYCQNLDFLALEIAKMALSRKKAPRLGFKMSLQLPEEKSQSLHLVFLQATFSFV